MIRTTYKSTLASNPYILQTTVTFRAEEYDNFNPDFINTFYELYS